MKLISINLLVVTGESTNFIFTVCKNGIFMNSGSKPRQKVYGIVSEIM